MARYAFAWAPAAIVVGTAVILSCAYLALIVLVLALVALPVLVGAIVAAPYLLARRLYRRWRQEPDPSRERETRALLLGRSEEGGAP